MRKLVAIGAPALAGSVVTTLVVALTVPSVAPFEGDSGDDRATGRDRCVPPWPTGRGHAPGSSHPPGQATPAGFRRSGLGRDKPGRDKDGRARPKGDEAESKRSDDSGSPKQSPDRPNIVTVMVDDMRADELSGPWMRSTRRLLADQGARFSNSFAPLPLCGPARASFLTGRYAHNTGVRENQDPSASDTFDDRDTLAVWLHRAGYRTAFVGKYLNGYAGDDPDVPKNAYVPPGWDDWYGSLGATTYMFHETKLSDDGHGIVDLSGHYQTSAYGRMGSRIVSRLAAERDPFYLQLSFAAPHTGQPRQPGDPQLRTTVPADSMRGAYDDRITRLPGVPGEPCNAGKPRAISKHSPLTKPGRGEVLSAARQRAEALGSVDKQVRRLIGTLRKTGELDDTYVIFTSDNGYFLGEFRRKKGKRMPYEPSLHTPTLVRGPGIESGIVRTQAFTSIDFAPTIADMAGLAPGRKVDGISLLPSATGRDRGWHRPILTDTAPDFGHEYYGLGVRLPGVLYEEYQDEHTPRELFDLARDPHENYNVVDTPHYRRARRALGRILDSLRDCRGEECRISADRIPGITGDS